MPVLVVMIAVLVLAAGYLAATRRCMSGYHRHRHWRYRHRWSHRF